MPPTPPELQALSPTALGAVLLVLGLLYALAGFLFLRFLVALSGFLVAGAAAVVLVQFFTPDAAVTALAAGILGGICGALAMIFIYRLAIFLVCGAGVFFVAQPFFASRPEAWAPWAPAGIGVLGGILAVVLEKPIIILATAILGGRLAVQGGVLLLLGPGSEQYAELSGAALPTSLLVLGAWGALSLLGLAIQFATARKRRR